MFSLRRTHHCGSVSVMYNKRRTKSLDSCRDRRFIKTYHSSKTRKMWKFTEPCPLLVLIYRRPFLFRRKLYSLFYAVSWVVADQPCPEKKSQSRLSNWNTSLEFNEKIINMCTSKHIKVENHLLNLPRLHSSKID